MKSYLELRAYPDVRLSQLSWQASDDPKSLPSIRPMSPHEAPPVKAIAKSGPTLRLDTAESNNPPFAGGRYQRAP